MENVNIYFDEKGPTKTIRPAKSDKQFNHQESDDIPSYVGIYLAVPKSQQNSFNKKYEQIINEYKRTSKNKIEKQEIKAETLLAKFSSIPEVKENVAKVYNSLFELIDTTGAKFQLSSFDKTQILVTSRLTPWLYYLDSIGENLHMQLYTINKYLRTEDVFFNKKFTYALGNEELNTSQILNVLKQQLMRARKLYKNKDRAIWQNMAFLYLIELINKTPENIEKIHFSKPTFPIKNLAFGVDLWISEDNMFNNHSSLTDNKDTITFILDEDAPYDGLTDLGYTNILPNVHSEDYAGIQACDLLAGIYGKLISLADNCAPPDHKRPGKLIYADELFTQSFNQYKPHSEAKKLLENLYNSIFASEYTYTLVHSEFSDYLITLKAWLKLLIENPYFNPSTDTKFLAEKHSCDVKLSLEHEYYNMMQSHIKIHDYFGGVEQAIKSGNLLPLI